jgi:hypothetical protein
VARGKSEADSSSGDDATTIGTKRPSVLLWIAALAVVCVFLGHDTHRLSAPFGPSHDGNNSAAFMAGGRAIVDDGPFAAKLGASVGTVSGQRIVYAHHPPLVYVEDALAVLPRISAETAARLPAAVSSLAALILVVLLLHECGLRPGAAALGLLSAFATPMFYVFGGVTEPLILGLAPMVCLTLLWQRLRNGTNLPAAALAFVAAFATLTSWEAALFSLLVGVALLIDRRRVAAAAVLAGVAVGVLLTGLWILWAYHGDVGEFLDRALLRAGSGQDHRVGLHQMTRQQMRYLGDLFPVGTWFVGPLAAVGLLDRRTRVLVAVSLGTVLAYAMLFKNGAFDHPYWLYCLLLPLALGAAVATDAISRWLARGRLARALGTAGAVVLVVALAVTVWHPSNEQEQNRIGGAVGTQARVIKWPAEQRYAYYAFGGQGPTDLLPWLLFYARREPFGVDGPRSVPHEQIVLTMVDGRLRVEPGQRDLKR